MTVTLDEFMKDFTPKERAKVKARTATLIERELTLRDLRQAEQLTQERMAELLGVEQENVSRLERRADLLLSTLSGYVAAMGGRLRLIAEFPNRKPVVIALGDIAGGEPLKSSRRGEMQKPVAGRVRLAKTGRTKRARKGSA